MSYEKKSLSNQQNIKNNKKSMLQSISHESCGYIFFLYINQSQLHKSCNNYIKNNNIFCYLIIQLFCYPFIQLFCYPIIPNVFNEYK